MAARSGDKAREVIENIKSKNPNSTGDVIYLHLDLDNLSTIKKSAEKFLSREKRLDVLWNNAGVMMSPKGSKTQQGYEKQLGTNALGPFLFTQQLMGVLSSTAKDSPEASVRVVWLSSSMVQLLAPPGGVDMGNLDYKTEKGAMHKYAVSKAANTFYSTELARRHSDDGIVSVSLDPGNLRTGLQREASPWFRRIWNLALNPAIHGAHTELFAGLSPAVTTDKNGSWIVPYGRFGALREDIERATRSKEMGGSSIAKEIWDWSEREVQQYV
ncbi:retinol dehydrogenase 12 [Hypoxylon argillaceum]|nr:retinol dehydrogenase 12 [Hypoxylon argillaceum]